MATVFRPPFVVPRPADHSDWRFAPRGSPLLAALLTNVRVYGVGGQVPTKAWHYDYDVGQSVWQGRPIGAAPLGLLTAVKFFGAGGQAPNSRRNYDYLLDESLWIGRPTASALLAPLLTSAGPLKCRGWFLFADEDGACWNPVLARNFRLLNAGPVATPFVPVFYKFGVDDPSVWHARPLPSALLAPLLTVGGQVKSRQWLWGHDDAPPWVRTVARNVNLYNVPAATPFVPVFFRFGGDEPPVWNAKPQASVLLAPLLTAAGQVKSRQWLWGQDEPPPWLRAVARNVNLYNVPAATPIVNPPWKFGFDDASGWQASPSASILLARLLTIGGQVKSRQWLFGLDDAAGWRPVLARNFRILNVTASPPSPTLLCVEIQVYAAVGGTPEIYPAVTGTPAVLECDT